MINIFKKFFAINKPKQQASIEEPVKCNFITFSIDQWDRMRIDIAIQNEGSNYAETFGKLLYAVNHGLYEDKILECLIALSKSNPSLVPPIQQALTSWGIMIIDKTSEDMKKYPEPFVKPTSVFHK
jgi:hypothetical protein